MNSTNTCPCCSEPLLRHARRNGIYWFCPHCRQEMPNLISAIVTNRDSSVRPHLYTTEQTSRFRATGQ